MPELIAGFDAGQSHTRCRLTDADNGAVLGEGEGPGVRHLASPGGVEAFQLALEVSLKRALEALGPGRRGRLRAAAVGASGIEVGSAVQEQGRLLAAAALHLPAEHTAVTGDERTALRGAMGTASEGVVLISGTGTIAVGRNRHAVEHRCAGWGWLLDGAGSAMDIGRDGLSASLEMADGRRPDSGLRQRLWEALGVSPHAPGAAAAIKARVVQPEFGAAGFAALAPAVAAGAEAGDQTAAAILRRNSAALATMAITISRRLGLEAPPVWPLGGALEHLPLLRDELEQALALRLPSAHLARPAGDACAGALSLARELPALRRH
ncbi:MAG: BadF/BadG/BcrA/BcrD ATPase family protein [Prochlorococcaceae cyanobacterium]